jgi:hypothetical protein
MKDILPDIVSAVLLHAAGDWAALNASLRVNRLWAAVTLPLPWRHVPRAALKGAVDAAKRSHNYDSAIRVLDVTIMPQRFGRVRRRLFGRQRRRRRRRRHGGDGAVGAAACARTDVHLRRNEPR